MEQTVVHLVDDATPGGVNRMLTFLCEREDLARGITQTIVRIRRGQLAPPPLNADLIVSHLSASWANFPFMTALRADQPTTALVHVEHSYSERFTALNVENKARFHTLLQSTYALFDRVISVSDAQAGWIMQAGLCERDSLITIRPCVDLAAFLALRPARPRERLTVGAIGRLDQQKGFDLLVKAFADPALARHRLLIVGDGQEGAALRALAGDRENVAFVPFTSDPAAAMAECDVVAMPSRWEPYGLVALEAMAAGRPVLTTRCDGLRDHIAEGAIDIGENTPNAWADALTSLTPDELDRATERGRQCAGKATETFISRWDALMRTPPVPAD